MPRCRNYSVSLRLNPAIPSHTNVRRSGYRSFRCNHCVAPAQTTPPSTVKVVTVLDHNAELHPDAQFSSRSCC